MQTNPNDDQLALMEWSTVWKNQPVERELNFIFARRQQTRRRWIFYMDLLAALVMFMTGFFFFWLPLSLPTLMGAPVLLLSACLVAWGAFKIHRQAINYADWSAQGLLSFRRLNCLSSINYFKFNQLGCVIIIGFALVMVLLNFWLPGSAPKILIIIYGACLPALALLMWWLQRRINRYRVILEQTEKLLSDFDETV
jgi:hypothetical protein